MSRKIVFINQAVGYLSIDIINEFAKVFARVAVITGSIRVQDIPLDESVQISRIIRYNRGNRLKKGLSWLIGTLQIYLLLHFRYRTYDRFFFTIPPFAYLTSIISRMPFAIAVYDLYPEALKANGFGEDCIFYKWWSKRNRALFPKAQIIYALSQNLQAMVLAYAADAEVAVIPNWSAFSGFVPVTRSQNCFIIREKLEERFIVQYSGNIGVTHNVETLVEIAERLRTDEEILFQIIGRGDRTNFIRELVGKKQLTNCQLLPFRKDEELYESLCAAHLAVIILDDKTADISVPSKIYNIMAAGVPVMVIAPSMSDVSGIVKEYQVGAAFEKRDLDGMCEFILEIKNNPMLHNRFAVNSLNASSNYTKSNARKYLEHYLKNLD